MFTGLKNRLSLFWILQLVGWTGYALDRYLSSRRFFPHIFTYLLVAFALTFALRAIYKRLWARKPSLLKVGLVAVFCSVLAGFFWLVISQVIFWALKIDPTPNIFWFIYVRETARYTLVEHKPFLFLSWSALYFGIKYWQDVQEQEARALKAGALAQEAQLKMLRYQLNPHFLFNSLNSIQALIRENPQRAERMLGGLSEFLRYSLLHNKVLEVELEEEVEAARNYLDIEKIRFEDKLHVELEVETAASHWRVPCFLMHPLVENAIKYGMQTSALPLQVKLTASAENGSLRIEVRNTGKWVDKDSKDAPASLANGTGVGLQNVRERLAQAFPEQHRFDLFERDGWVHAVVEIDKK
jgi:two-component system LytT family sensor kinase